MEDIVIYCKSYIKDFDRVHNLLNSVERYNKDNILMYISVPQVNLKKFKFLEIKFDFLTVICDDDITPNPTTDSGWFSQQVYKMSFYRLKVSAYYLCIDSDSEFIRDFFKSDFIDPSGTAYLVCHEQKELLQWTEKAGLHFSVRDSYLKDRHVIMDFFNREGRVFDYGPSPVIWSSGQWLSFNRHVVQSQGLPYTKLLEASPSEFTWYGEFLKYSEVDKKYTQIQPLFKVFHYEQEYLEHKNKGFTKEDIAKDYLGIIMQSNWNAPITYSY